MNFDPATATATYIDSLGADALAKAAAYTMGNHWLLLWNLLVSAIVAWILVRTGVLDRINAKLARRGVNLRTGVVAAAYFVLANLVSLPWAMYEEFFRERSYGRTSQPLGDFLGQAALSTVIFALLVGLFLVGVYALMRRAGKYWWVWSGGLTAGALSFFLLAGPVVIEPLFNEYKPVPAGEVRDALVVMAAQAGVPADRIFVFDGSRQSNNFTANVSGIAGSARIAISDVAFKGASLDEVKAVTGHEIGHYVLGHIWRTVLLMSALAIAVLLPGRPDVSATRPRVRQHGAHRRADRPAGARIPGGGLLPVRTAAHQRVDPHGRERGRPVFARDGEPAGRAGVGAREDRRVSLSATGGLAGGPVLHPSLGRTTRAARDGVEGQPPDQSAVTLTCGAAVGGQCPACFAHRDR